MWGGTHRVEAYQLEGKFFVNPGSATGAFFTGWPDIEDLEEEEVKNTSTENGTDASNDHKAEETPEAPRDPVPSFCLLDIQGTVCVLYIYSYVDGEVKVDKISYRKEA